MTQSSLSRADDDAARTRDALRRAFDAATPEPSADLGLQRLLARCGATAAPPDRVPAWTRRLLAWFQRPAVSLALAGMLLTQTVGMLWWLAAPPPAAWSEWRSPATAAATVTWRLSLQPGSSEAALRRLLADHALAVSGTPSLVGEWWVSGAAEDAERTEASLRASGLVLTLERDPQGPPAR